jgi:hypothetical protein
MKMLSHLLFKLSILNSDRFFLWGKVKPSTVVNQYLLSDHLLIHCPVVGVEVSWRKRSERRSIHCCFWLTSDEQINLGESQLGLLQCFGVSKMEQIINAITVNAHWSTHRWRIDRIAIAGYAWLCAVCAGCVVLLGGGVIVLLILVLAVTLGLDIIVVLIVTSSSPAASVVHRSVSLTDTRQLVARRVDSAALGCNRGSGAFALGRHGQRIYMGIGRGRERERERKRKR